MRWIVGTDLGTRSEGALHMASWLCATAVPKTPAELVAITVLDGRLLALADEGRLLEAAQQALADALARAGLGASVVAQHVAFASTPEIGLGEAVTTSGIDGAIIGRIGRRDSASPWRLGSVARRLLRRLPRPIMVVPPDVATDAIGRGPILLATDLGEDSVAAGKLARRLATELDRPLLVVHVDGALVLTTSMLGYGIPMPTEMGPVELPEVEAWIDAQGLGPATARLLEGDTADRLIDCAREEQVPFMVCGSRRLSMVERIYGTSVGMELARRSERAVLVVPPLASDTAPQP